MPFPPSSSMGLILPIVDVDVGPYWAQLINNCLSTIDSHDHTPGHGVQITPDGIDVTKDMSMNGHSLGTAKSVQLSPQATPVTAAGSLYEYTNGGATLGDLWFTDGNNIQVQLTKNGVPVSGGFSGLPSGTAAAYYSLGQYFFESATNSFAQMNVGPLTLSTVVAGSNTITITPPISFASSYSITLPAAVPATTSMVTLDHSGQLATVTENGTGNVVLTTGATGVSLSTPTLTAPVISGQPTGTITNGSYLPVANVVVGSAPSVYNFLYSRVGYLVTAYGAFNVRTDSSGTLIFSLTTPLPPAPSGVFASGALAYGYCLATTGSSAVTIIPVSPSIGNASIQFNSSGALSGSTYYFISIMFSYVCAP